jgi:NADH dehydrogenase [ubiquinone] 1 alpha subcomplex assembly factor 4
MGKVLSVIKRKVNRFNVENRAHRVISKDKPTPAPKYPSTIQELETIKSGGFNINYIFLLWLQ